MSTRYERYSKIKLGLKLQTKLISFSITRVTETRAAQTPKIFGLV